MGEHMNLVVALGLMISLLGWLFADLSGDSSYPFTKNEIEKYTLPQNSIFKKIFKWFDDSVEGKYLKLRPLTYIRVIPLFVGIVWTVINVILAVFYFIFPKLSIDTFLLVINSCLIGIYYIYRIFTAIRTSIDDYFDKKSRRK